MSLVAHAERELRLSGLMSKEADYGGMIGQSALGVVQAFAGQGHSGDSAGLVIRLLEDLLRFEPLTPLTGHESEWVEVTESMGYPCWQNSRCSHVFMDFCGPYDLDRHDLAGISFPYQPARGDDFRARNSG